MPAASLLEPECMQHACLCVQLHHCIVHRGVNYTENICKLALTMWNSMQDDARGPWRQQRSNTGGISPTSSAFLLIPHALALVLLTHDVCRLCSTDSCPPHHLLHPPLTERTESSVRCDQVTDRSSESTTPRQDSCHLVCHHRHAVFSAHISHVNTGESGSPCS
jgi:hypothetical protein